MGVQRTIAAPLILLLQCTTSISAFSAASLQNSQISNHCCLLTATRRSDQDTRQSFRGKKRTTKIVNDNNSNNKSGIKTINRAQRNQQERPLLVDYNTNTAQDSEKRLNLESIGCVHFGECSGCTVNEKIGAVDVIRSAKMFFASTAVLKKRRDIQQQQFGDSSASSFDLQDKFFRVVVPSPLTGWRTQAKLAVTPPSSTWAKDGCEFGLYKRGTHQVISITDCQVHHPAINKALNILRTATNKAGVAAYSELNRDGGGLRYVQLQVERITGKIALTLVWNVAQAKEAQPTLSRLVNTLNKMEPNLWHSMWLNCNNSSGNNIFARNIKTWSRLSGPEFMKEPLPVGQHGWFFFSPLTFRQGNLDGFDKLALDVAQAVPGNSKVCELYAGVGVLGLTALAYHDEQGTPLQWLRCSDENPANPRCFSQSIESLPKSVTGRGNNNKNSKKEEKLMTLSQLAQTVANGSVSNDTDTATTEQKTSYTVATAARALKTGQCLGANVLIVDPPRRGLEEEVLDELCKPVNKKQPYVESDEYLTLPETKINWTNDVQKLIYVSCGFDALARDTDRLLASPGGWMLDEATGYILFPGSNHVETVAIFTRD